MQASGTLIRGGCLKVGAPSAMMLVYGDDSEDEKRERVCAIGVVFGEERSWASIESYWKERLAGIPFHANDCESDWGDFACFSHHDNKALYRDLATSLSQSYLHGA